ncbi:MAG: hypothetical protein HC828_21550 [Blastochloris sp.]|nr:hypothetical protein [Blastochloris sp.]
MLILFQPLLTALVGAALTLFGGIHGVLQWPTAAAWQYVVAASPTLLSVLVFLGCVLIALAGVAMLWAGITGTRTRIRQIRRVRWLSPGNQSYPGGDGPYDDQRW